MKKHISMHNITNFHNIELKESPKYQYVSKQSYSNQPNHKNNLMNTQTIAQKKQKCMRSGDHKNPLIIKQRQKNYKHMKNRLVELEDRLVKLKNSYENNKRKSKSQKRPNINGFNKKDKQPEDKNKENCVNGPTTKSFKSLQKNEYQYINYTPSLSKIAIRQCTALNNHKTNRLTPNNSQIQYQKIPNKIKTEISKQLINSKVSPLEEDILNTYITQQNVKNINLCRNKHSTSDTKLLVRSHVGDFESKNKKLNRYYYSQISQAFKVSQPNTFEQLCKAHFVNSIDFLKRFYNNQNNLKYQVNKISKNIRKLPPPNKPQTIILDMDQTLMHCICKSQKQLLSVKCDIKLPIMFPDRKKLTVGINIRPYVQECLQQLSKNFQLIIFTASHSSYANVVINHLDPKNQLISYRFYRQSCIKSDEGYYIKDLRVIDRKLQNILLVDNAAYSFCLQPTNGVPIVPFYQNKADFELKSLSQYLRNFIGQQDMRIKNNQLMKLSRYSETSDPQNFLQDVLLA